MLLITKAATLGEAQGCQGSWTMVGDPFGPMTVCVHIQSGSPTPGGYYPPSPSSHVNLIWSEVQIILNAYK